MFQMRLACLRISYATLVGYFGDYKTRVLELFKCAAFSSLFGSPYPSQTAAKMATPMDIAAESLPTTPTRRVLAPGMPQPAGTPPSDVLLTSTCAAPSLIVEMVTSVSPDVHGPGTKSTKRALFANEGSCSKKIRSPAMPCTTTTLEVAEKCHVVVHSDLATGIRNCSFEGRVLSRYGLYVKGLPAKKQNLCCELLDVCGEITMNLAARTTALAKNSSNVLRVGSWICVSNFQVKPRESWDCGISPNSIDLTTASTIFVIEDRSILRFIDMVATSNKISWFKLQKQYTHGTFALAVFQIREDANAGAIIVFACTNRNHDDATDIRIWRQQVTSLGEIIQHAWDGGAVPVFYIRNIIKGPEGCGGNTRPETIIFPIENEAQTVELVNAGRLHAGYAGCPMPMKREDRQDDTKIIAWLNVQHCEVRGSAFVCPGCKSGTVTMDENNLPICLYCGKQEEVVLVGHLNVLLVEYDELVTPPKRTEHPTKLPCDMFAVAFNYDLGEFEVAAHSDWGQHCHKLWTTNKYGIWYVNYRGWVTGYEIIYEDDVLGDIV